MAKRKDRKGVPYNFWLTEPDAVSATEMYLEYVQARGGFDSGVVAGKTDFFRQLVGREVEIFQHAPYRSEPSLFFVLVTGNGDVLNLYRQRLHFNAAVPRLPLSLAFSEKKRYALAKRLRRQKKPAFGADFKNHWLLHAFSSWPQEWPGDNSSTAADLASLNEPAQTEGDREGVSKKFRRLPLEETSGTAYTTERLKLIKDYILRLDASDKERASLSGSNTDHADFDLVVPSLRTTFYIIVDLDIYEGRALRQKASVGYKLRLIGGPTWETSLPYGLRPEWVSGRYVNGVVTGDSRARGLIPELESLTANAYSRTAAIYCDESLRDSTVSPWMSDAVLGTIKMPKDFIFGKLDWPFPPFGLQISLSWSISDVLLK